MEEEKSCLKFYWRKLKNYSDEACQGLGIKKKKVRVESAMVRDITWDNAEAICRTRVGRAAHPKLAAVLNTARKTNYFIAFAFIFIAGSYLCGVGIDIFPFWPTLLGFSSVVVLSGLGLVLRTYYERLSIEIDRETEGSPYLASLLGEENIELEGILH